MPKLLWQSAGAPITQSDLANLEAELAIQLPSKYRDFLYAQNGGVPNRRWFKIPDHFDGDDAVQEFLGIDYPDDADDLAASWRTFHEYATRRLFPIATTEFSGIICIDLSTPGAEPVVYMEWSDPDPPEERKPYYLAADIDEFCARLCERVGDEAP